jgi:hypothetical protein
VADQPAVLAPRPWWSRSGSAAFARITLLPTILVMAWLLVGLPLLLARAFLPAPALLIAAVVAVVFVAALRRVPARWPRALSGSDREPDRAASGRPGWSAWWAFGATTVVAGGFALWQYWFNSESVIVLRTPGAYLQTGYWLAQHGSLPIPQSLSSFGGAQAGLSFSSTGFFAHGTSVVPGLMSGLPLILAGGFWVHGITAAAALGPILGGLAVLSFGGLAGRLAGPRWAPAAALVLALTLPEQYTSRGPFSETVAQVLLFGGLSLVVDAMTLGDPASDPGVDTAPLPRVRPGRLASLTYLAAWDRWGPLRRGYTPQRAALALGGLALGLSSLVRFEGLLDIAPAIVFIGVLMARRMIAAGLSFCVGLVIGVGYGLIDGYVLARPFLDSLRPLPELVGLLVACLVALTLIMVQLLLMPGLGRHVRALAARRPLRWLPDAGGVLAVAALIGLAVRPYLQTVRGAATGATAVYVASLQRLENLPVDPGRLYAEDTLYWVIWYVGLPALLLGAFGVALLLRRCLRALLSWRDPGGSVRIWALPLLIICWGSAAALWQPQTVPDQPWASRRLVPLVIPGLILCAVWASAWLHNRARSRGASRGAAWAVAACCVVALLVPTAATTFGIGLNHSGKAGALRITTDGPALKRTGQGEVGAVNGLCSSLGPSASVVIVDQPVAQQFSQVIRGMCGVPVASMSGQSESAVENVVFAIGRTGRRAVLLGGRASELSNYGGDPIRVLDLTTTQDPHTLTRPPGAPGSAHYEIWMTAPGSASTGL